MNFFANTDTNTKIPESFKKWYDENLNKFNSEIDIPLSEEDMYLIEDLAILNTVTPECCGLYLTMNAFIKSDILERDDYTKGMLYFDFELYDEDQFSELIDENQKILIYNDDLEPISVLLSVELYDKLKNISDITK
jgi:hypothetical protein